MRTIIQIVSSEGCIFALCNDGTVWKWNCQVSYPEWVDIDPIPQPPRSVLPMTDKEEPESFILGQAIEDIPCGAICIFDPKHGHFRLATYDDLKSPKILGGN